MSRLHHRARARALGHELERLHRQAGMPSQQVSKLLGWSAPTMSRIENGGRDTAPEEIAAAERTAAAGPAWFGVATA